LILIKLSTLKIKRLTSKIGCAQRHRSEGNAYATALPWIGKGAKQNFKHLARNSAPLMGWFDLGSGRLVESFSLPLAAEQINFPSRDFSRQFLAMTCLDHKGLKIGLAVVALLAPTGVVGAREQYPPGPDLYYRRQTISMNTEA
jgi:hypothetical protein